MAPTIRPLSRENQQQPRRDPQATEAATAIGPDSPPDPGVIMEEAEALISSEGAIKSGKLAGKSMWAAIWILALPVLLQQVMQACVGLVDKLLAGRLPADIVRPAMDAIGIGLMVQASNTTGDALRQQLEFVRQSGHADRFAIFTGLDLRNVGPGSGARIAAQLEADIRAGAAGVGEIGKGFGLSTRKADGSRLATGSYDLTVRIWEVATTTELLALKVPGRQFTTVAVGPHGYRVAAGSTSGRVAVWNLGPE